MIHEAKSALNHSASPSPSLLECFCAHSEILSLNRPIPAQEPDPEPNPAPDAPNCNGNSHSHISARDWDELFRAIQDRLAHCVADPLTKPPGLTSPQINQVIKTTVLQCVRAMQQLHEALKIERSETKAHQLPYDN